MSARKRPVARIVAATLVTVTTLLLAIFGAGDYTSRNTEEWNRLRRVTRAQTNELAVALAVPVWNIDRAQIEQVLDSQAEVMQIEGIVVEAAGQTHARVRDANGRFVSTDRMPSTTGLLNEERPITFDGQQVGTVSVFTTPRLIQQQLRSELIRTVAAILTVDLLLILSVYWVLWRNVLHPLVEIERYAGAVSAGGNDEVATVAPGPTAELESLRVSIETMVRLLDQRYQALKESEERFRTIFDSANDAIFINDEEGTFLDVNAKMCEMFGYTREEALTQDSGRLSSGLEPYTHEGAVARRREALAGHERIFEWHARHKDGHLFWVEISTRLATLDGKRRIVYVVRNIDQRKEMERELRRRETMSAMGTLVAGVAHEVRNPLFGMTALLDANADVLSTPALQELATGLREQVTRLTHLTRELLEFGAPVRIALEPGSLAELVNEAIEGHADAASKERITLRSTIAPSLPNTPMDRARMRQVFDNLLDNALQHSPPEGVITIGATEVVQGGRSWIESTIEDDGQGFRPGDLDRVFEPFFTRRERGIGLGMSIVQRIVEEHSGRVTAGNRPRGGAVVTVRLPAV